MSGIINDPNTPINVKDVGGSWSSAYKSPNTILFMDDFEAINAAKWWDASTGIGSGSVLSNAVAWRGNQSMQLTTGAAIGDMGGIYKYMPYPASTRIGIEAKFALDWNIGSVLIGLSEFVGDDNVYGYHIRYYRSSTPGNFSLYAQTGPPSTYRPVTSPLKTYAGLDGYWLPIKLIVDFGTKQYMKCMIGDHFVDIPFTPMGPQPGWGVYRYLTVLIRIYNSLALNVVGYVDDFIMTQEP